MHEKVRCTECHTKPVFTDVGKNCADCHADIHRRQMGANCAQCHTPLGLERIGASDQESLQPIPAAGRARGGGMRPVPQERRGRAITWDSRRPACRAT